MKVNVRREQRSPSKEKYVLSWQDGGGLTHSAEAQGRDFSHSGVGLVCPVAVPEGSSVYVEAQGGYPTGYSVVRHCMPQQGRYVIGLELDDAVKKNRDTPLAESSKDHYEFLQISPNAQAETIHRVYRFLAARFHPDNPETGHREKFLRLNQAFEVLSHPERRADYDAELRKKQASPNPIFDSVDFLDGIEGEMNRRLAVLSLLYRRCRARVNDPRVSLLDLEAQMGFPREYLDFTTWYLRTKKYITREDNSDFSLTALGVDYVEANSSKLPLLNKLLKTGTAPGSSENGHEGSKAGQAKLILGAGEFADQGVDDTE